MLQLYARVCACATYHKEAAILLVLGMEDKRCESRLAVRVEDREGQRHKVCNKCTSGTVPDVDLTAFVLYVQVFVVPWSAHHRHDHLGGVKAVRSKALDACCRRVCIGRHGRGRHNFGTAVAHTRGRGRRIDLAEESLVGIHGAQRICASKGTLATGEAAPVDHNVSTGAIKVETVGIAESRCLAWRNIQFSAVQVR